MFKVMFMYYISFYYKVVKSMDIMRLVIDVRVHKGGPGLDRLGKGI